jgi:hypothetical protein
VLFFYLYCKSIIGNLTYNLVNTSTDDSLISHALAYSNPENFINDFRAANFRLETTTSLINFIPAIFLELFLVKPIIFYLFFLILQIILLPISIYLFCRSFNLRLQEICIVILSVLLVRPYFWNLTWTGDLEWMPYATWLALPFFILYITFKKQNQIYLCYFSLLLGTLIHPTFGLVILFFDLVLTIVQYKLNLRNIILSKFQFIIYFIILAFTLANLAWIRLNESSGPPISYVNAILNNNHFRALLATPNDITWRTTFSFWLLNLIFFLIFAKHWDKFKLNKFNLSFLITSSLCLVLFILFHLFGLLINNLSIIRFLSVRFTIFTSTIFFIFSSILIITKKKNTLEKIIFHLFILFPGIFMIAIFAVYEFFSNSFVRKYFKYLFALTTLTIFFTLLSFEITQVFQFFKIQEDLRPGLNNIILILRSYSPYGNLATDFLSNEYILSILFLCVVFLIYTFLVRNIFDFSNLKYLNNIYFNVFGILLMVTMLILGRNYETKFRHPEGTSELLQVQSWARQNTSPKDLFLGYAWSSRLGWRTYSERGMVSLTDCGSSAYFYSRSDRRCQELGEILFQNSISINQKFKVESYLTGADYILRKRDDEPLNFKIIYQNDKFIVYKIVEER